MTLPVSPNSLSFSQIQTEFGGSNPISLSEYYRSGSYVRTNTTAPNGPIVTTGAISLSTFRGATQGVLTPTYAFGTIPTSIDEGSSGTFNVTTTNVADGTILYWTIATNAGDFSTTSGSFTINSNTGSFSVSPSADSTTETAAETFTVAIRTGSTSGTVQATSSAVTINDTSTTPAPTPPSSATWSVGFSNNGTAGPISTFINVILNRAATVSTSYTFTGVVVQNSVTFPCPTVTIPIGSTSPAVAPNAFSGITNGSGPYSTITLRVTPSTVPYPLTPSTKIDTPFSYSP